MIDSATIPATFALEGEIWLAVPNFSSYLVSNRGRVWSSCGMGRFLKPVRRGVPGYPKLGVTLSKGPIRWQVYVHQLVMLAFVGECPEGQEIRHLDGDPFNNRWEPGDEAETKAAGGNLFYGTHVENARDMIEHGNANGCGKLGADHPKAKLTEDLVRQIRSEYAAGGVTERVLAARHGVNVGTIHALLVRRTWKHVA